MSYPQMTEAQIKALPKAEQKYAYRANPELAVGHYDCQCPKCSRRYSADLRRTALKRLQCPYCNGGKVLADYDEHREGSWCALLRAQGEERLFCLFGRHRVEVDAYRVGLPEYVEVPS